MIGAISDALISRASARISETAPGRTPIAAARPPLVLPGFASPRSIILMSSMALSFPNFRNDSNSDYPKSSLTLISEYQKFIAVSLPASLAITEVSGREENAIDKLGERALRSVAGVSGEG